MPAATNKQDLLRAADRDYAKLQEVIARVPPEMATRVTEDTWSIRDVLIHRAHWIDLFLRWYQEGQAGRPVAFPAEGYKWNQLKEYNEMILAKNAEVGWEAAQVRLAAAHQAWHALVDGLEDEALYGAPMKGGNNNWTAGRWAEAAAPSHYRSAAKFIRACLRQAAQ